MADTHRNARPPVPSSKGSADLDKPGQTNSSSAGGAKNPWVRTGRLWNLHLGAYNVRTLASEGRLEELLEEIKDIKWDIIGMSEVRRTGEEFITLNNSGHVLCYKGLESEKKYGVGFLINKKLAGNVETFYSLSERVAGIIIKLNKRYRMKIITVYAPTSTHSDEESEKFYEDVEKAMKEHKTQFTYVIGDYNAKVGKHTSGINSIGKFGVGDRNDRGESLIEFAETHSLKIANTFYKKKESRKWTWIGPNGETKNEIDFILTDRLDTVKDITVLNKVRGSDHRFVRGRIGINLRREREKLVKPVEKPDNKVVMKKEKEFQLEIKNRFEALEKTEKNIETTNEELTEIIMKAALEIGGREPRTENRKLSNKTRGLIQKRKELIIKTDRDRIEASELGKAINKAKTQDVRDFNMKKVKEALEAGTSIKMAKRKLGQGRKQMFALRNENGEMTRNRDEVIKVAEKFYKTLYSSKEKKEVRNEEEIKKIDPVPEVKDWEVEYAVKAMSRGKAGGEDGLTIDLIKDAGQIIWNKLARLFTRCLESQTVPVAWKNAMVVLLHKKGDIKDLKNYRPISLLPVLYKLFTKIITNRINETLDREQPREQAGFRSGYSTHDHIHTLNQLIEKQSEFNRPLCLAFIDYEKAFDSVEKSAVMEAMRNQGIEEAYVRTLDHIYEGSTATIKLHKTSDKVPIEKGVRQGDTISPKLFTAVLEEIFRKLNWEKKGININGEKLNNLRFADDIVLTSEDPEEMKEMLEQIRTESLKVGLKMNIKKTKVMYNGNVQGPHLQGIQIGNDTIERVDEYIYLGQKVKAGPGQEDEIKRRIAMGWTAFGRHSNILRGDIPMCLKRKVFNTCIVPVIIYGAETWSLTKVLERKIQATQRSMERKMLGITWKDKKRNTWIREQTSLEDILTTIKRRKWSWAGHIMRRTDNRWTTRITEWQPREGRRNRGMQKRRWRDEIRKYAGATWVSITQNREKWKSLSEAFSLQWDRSG